MTTIACDSTGMAGDTQTTAEGQRGYCATKVHRVRGWLVGYAGSLSWAAGFMRELQASGKTPLGFLREYDCEELAEEVSLLLLSPRGHIWHWEGREPYRDARGFAACGSGEAYALAAMYVGYSPLQAVNVAIEFDTATGGVTTHLPRKRT